MPTRPLSGPNLGKALPGEREREGFGTGTARGLELPGPPGRGGAFPAWRPQIRPRTPREPFLPRGTSVPQAIAALRVVPFQPPNFA